MSLLMRAREITGRPVVTLDTAEDVAEIKDVVFDHSSASLVGFTLNKRGFLGSPMKAVLPWSRVSALGPDAIMIASESTLGEGDAAMDQAAKDTGGRDVIGATVMADSGTALGTIVDVILDVDDRVELVGFEMHGPAVERGRKAATLLIPVDDTLAVSGETLMVPAAAQDFVRDDLSGFGSAVEEFRARLHEGGH